MKSLNKSKVWIAVALGIGALVFSGEKAEARRRGGDDDHHRSRHDHHRSSRTIHFDHHRDYAYINQFGNIVIVRDGARTHHGRKSRSSHHHRGGHHRHSGH